MNNKNKNWRGTNFEATQIANSNQKNLSRKDVYNLKFYNDTANAITVSSGKVGVLTIPAGANREWKGHPSYPVDLINLKVEFVAGAPNTDYLTVLISTSYGSQCKNPNL